MRLLIAIPTLDYMYFGFVESLMKLLMYLKDDGVDFLEILNISDTILDLSSCKIGNKKLLA